MSIFRQKDSPRSLGGAIQSSVEYCGAVFVLLGCIDANLNTTLPMVLKEVRAHEAQFVGMMSGVLQILVRDKVEQNIEQRAKLLCEAISARNTGAAIVWTVQHCTHGCWGDDTAVSYGALIPNFREIMKVLASSKPGAVMRM